MKTIVKHYKGKDTSANLPYRVEFMLEQDSGKQQKWFAHLVSIFSRPIYPITLFKSPSTSSVPNVTTGRPA